MQEFLQDKTFVKWVFYQTKEDGFHSFYLRSHSIRTCSTDTSWQSQLSAAKLHGLNHMVTTITSTQRPHWTLIIWLHGLMTLSPQGQTLKQKHTRRAVLFELYSVEQTGIYISQYCFSVSARQERRKNQWKNSAERKSSKSRIPKGLWSQSPFGPSASKEQKRRLQNVKHRCLAKDKHGVTLSSYFLH